MFLNFRAVEIFNLPQDFWLNLLWAKWMANLSSLIKFSSTRSARVFSRSSPWHPRDISLDLTSEWHLS